MTSGGRIALAATARRFRGAASRAVLATVVVAAAMICADVAAQAQRGGYFGGYAGPRPSNGMEAGYGIRGGGFGVGVGVMSGMAVGAAVGPGVSGDVMPTRRPRPMRAVPSDPGPSRSARRGRDNGGVPPAGEARYVPDEVVIELVGDPNNQSLDALAARHRLTRVESQRIGLTDSTWVRWRITDRRSVPAVIRDVAGDRAVRWVQPNYLFALEEVIATDSRPGENADSRSTEKSGEPAGDPAQYALPKLHLPEAQVLSRGNHVVVAVIDTEIDKTNPELAGVITESYDALSAPTPLEPHGTGIAGIIAAHVRLLGAAPEAHIMAIRAFGAGQGTTFAIVKGLDYAVAHGAKIVNMSFSGPSDPALARNSAAAHGKGVVLIAAAGNHGPKSPPLYPAADPNVIAVTATDSSDRLFGAANRGDYIAVAAPGVDILVPAPGGLYVMSSGTSFASAYVAGTAALLVEHKPDLAPDAVKKALMSTAHDLGPKGHDDQFGAGLIDANQALMSIEGRPAADLSAPAAR